MCKGLGADCKNCACGVELEQHFGATDLRDTLQALRWCSFEDRPCRMDRIHAKWTIKYNRNTAEGKL